MHKLMRTFIQLQITRPVKFSIHSLKMEGAGTSKEYKGNSSQSNVIPVVRKKTAALHSTSVARS